MVVVGMITHCCAISHTPLLCMYTGREVHTYISMSLATFFLPPFSADPLSNMSLVFDTKEEAVAYAVKNGQADYCTHTHTHTVSRSHLGTTHTPAHLGQSSAHDEPDCSGTHTFPVASPSDLCPCLPAGWGYEIEQPKRSCMVAKTYAENFSWDKKTRVVSK